MNLNNESQKEIQLKEKSYTRKNNKTKSIVIIIVLILVYMAFFTSKLWMFPKLKEASHIGEKQHYMLDRTASLVSCIYDENKREMEIVLNLENDSLDNIDTYYYAYSCVGQNPRKIQLKERYNEKLFTVLRISNLKKGYRELKLFLAPQIVKKSEVNDSITASFVINKNNVTFGKIKDDKSKNDYINDRLNSIILEQKASIKKVDKNIKKLNAKLAAIEKNKADYEKDKDFLSDAEKEKYRLSISVNEEEKSALKNDIAEANAEKERLEKELAELYARQKKL